MLIMCGTKAGVVLSEDALERVVQHGCPDVEERLHRRPVPPHLLLLVHAPGHDLVDRALDKRGRDRLAAPAPGRIMNQRVLVAREVAEQIVDMSLETFDADHLTQGLALRLATEGRELAPASWPAAVPQAPLGPLQAANRLTRVCGP
jgi:hypothetical protein